MSQEDLENAGVLLPKEEWGTRSLEATANRLVLSVVGLVAVLSVGLMYLGGGRELTWIGAGAYLVDLAVFTWRSWRAVGD